MGDGEQAEVRKPKDGEEFARFILLAANQCDLAPEELFVAFSNVIAATAVSWTESQDSAVRVAGLTLEHALSCIRSAYQQAAGHPVMQ